MTIDEAVELLDAQPVGTFLVTAVPREYRGSSYTSSAFMKTAEGWATKAGWRAGTGERYQAHNVAPILTDFDDMTFIWSLS